MKKSTFFIAFFLILFSSLSAQRKVDVMDRGIIAMPRSSSQIYVSWRHFATDPDEIAYNLYYKTSEAGALTKANPNLINNSTNFTVGLNTASADYTFVVKSVLNGVETDEPGSFTLPRSTIASRIVHDFDFEPLPAGTPAMGMKFCWPADLNGDGRYDYVMDRQNYGVDNYPSPKVEAYTSKGEFLWRVDMGYNVKISEGHSDMVTAYDMDGDGKAEVLMVVSEGTTFADGKVVTAANGTVTDYRTRQGSSPRWISVVNGQTGVEIDRVDLPYFNDLLTTRSDDWKEITGHFIIAYLDGIRPSLIYQYKNRLANNNFQGAHAAWSFSNGSLHLDWAIKDTWGLAEFHQVRAGDVDGDGYDEFVEGGYVLDQDGSVLNRHEDVIHGDRHTLADIDPDRPGLEHFLIQQDSPKTLGMGLFDAKTGEMIKGLYQSAVGDVGRGICAAFDPTRRGLQFWSTMNGSQMYDAKGNIISGAYGTFPAEPVWWGADLARWEISGIGSSGANLAFHKYNTGTKGFDRDSPNLYNEDNGHGAYYFSAAYGGRAAFWGDMLGDWREEIVCVRSNNTGFVVLSTWEQTNHRIYHLMQNPAYRVQTTARGYYQTADVDFYMAADMPKPPVAPVQTADVYYTAAGWVDADGIASTYADGKSVMYDLRGGDASVSINDVIQPSRVWLMNPLGKDYTFNGTGKLSGAMDLIKSMQGDVVLNGNHDYSGLTRVSEGRLFVNGTLASPVQVDARGVIGGVATLSGGVTLEKGLNKEGGRLEPGMPGQIGTLTIQGALSLPGRNNLAFEVDQTKVVTNDSIVVKGDFMAVGKDHTIIIHAITPLTEGKITLLTFTGTTNVSADQFSFVGLEGIPYELRLEANTLTLDIQQSRSAGRVEWSGAISNIWDFQTSNFLFHEAANIFVPGDTVRFDDSADRKTIVINETMPVGQLQFDNDMLYSISGQGVISGDGGLSKTGSGKLSILNTENSFTGPVVIEGGILEVASLKDGGLASSIGASSSAASNWIMRNAELHTKAQMATNRNMTIEDTLTVYNATTGNSVLVSGNMQGVGSTMITKGKGTLSLQGRNVFAKVLHQDGLLLLASADANRYSLGSAKIELQGGTFRMHDINSTSNTGTFSNAIEVPAGKTATWDLPSRWGISSRLSGSGTLNVYVPYVRSDLNGDWSAFEGRINFLGRDIRMNNAAARNIPLAEVSLGEGTWLYVASNGSGESGTAQTFTFGALSGVGGISGRNSLVIGSKNINTTYSGATSSGGGRLTKVGTGNQTLSGANLYTGGTLINGGKLTVSNTTGSATGTGAVSVNDGAALAGTGTVAGITVVNAGATLMPGATETAIGTLKFGSSLMLKTGSTLVIKTLLANNDKLTVAGTIDLKGTLEMKNMGGVYTAGRSYTIFTAGTVSGAFDSIAPATPGEGLYWDISRITEGIISVTNVNALNTARDWSVELFPTISADNFTVSGNDAMNELKVELLSLTGVLLFTDNSTDSSYTLNMSTFAAGNYLVRLTANDHSKVYKIIKK